MAWIFFHLFVFAMLYVDLACLHKNCHEVRWREALGWSFFWIALALVFCAGVWKIEGPSRGMQFLSGYLLEESLSVDNLFVFLLIFSYFKVPAQYQHKVLFWGIIGALVMRAVFIFTGVALIRRFEWTIYLFGAFLVFTGFKLFTDDEKEIEPDKNPVVLLLRRFMPVSPAYEGERLFVRRENRWWATPLFVVLLVIETSDIIFAIDSIPAVLSVSTDPFIVYTSNIFAILGLRSLYFALAGAMRFFHYLHYGLGAILIFVGVKMLISHFVHIPIGISLGVIGGVLMFSAILSIIIGKQKHEI